MAWCIVFVFHVCRVVVLESHLCQEVTRGGTWNEEGADLYIRQGMKQVIEYTITGCSDVARQFTDFQLYLPGCVCEVHYKQRFVCNTCT